MDVNKWCDVAGLTVNLAKVVLEPLKVQDTIIRPYKYVKYLCAILEQKLQWVLHT